MVASKKDPWNKKVVKPNKYTSAKRSQRVTIQSSRKKNSK